MKPIRKKEIKKWEPKSAKIKKRGNDYYRGAVDRIRRNKLVNIGFRPSRKRLFAADESWIGIGEWKSLCPEFFVSFPVLLQKRQWWWLSHFFFSLLSSIWFIDLSLSHSQIPKILVLPFRLVWGLDLVQWGLMSFWCTLQSYLH